MKAKLEKIQNEQKILSSTNDFLHSGLVSLLGDKKTRNIHRSIEELKISSERGIIIMPLLFLAYYMNLELKLSKTLKNHSNFMKLHQSKVIQIEFSELVVVINLVLELT